LSKRGIAKIAGSWLNLMENLFSNMTGTMLRDIPVSTKHELMDRNHLHFRARIKSFFPAKVLSSGSF